MRLVPLPLLLLALQLACECPAQSPAVAPRDVQSHAAASVPLRFSACDDEEFDSVVDLVEHELYAHAGGQVRPNGSLEGRAHGFAARSGGRANKTLVELLAEKLGPDPGQNPDPEGARPKRPALAVGITSNAVAFHMQRERGGRYTARDASASFEEAAAQDVKATVGEVGLAADARCTSGRSRRVRGKGGWSLHHTGLPSAGSEDDSRYEEMPFPMEVQPDDLDLPSSSACVFPSSSSAVGRRSERQRVEEEGSSDETRSPDCDQSFEHAMGGWGQTAALLKEDDDTSTPLSAGSAEGGWVNRKYLTAVGEEGLGAEEYRGSIFNGDRQLQGKSGALMLENDSERSALNERMLRAIRAEEHQPTLHKGAGDAGVEPPRHLADYTRLSAQEGVFTATKYIVNSTRKIEPDLLSRSSALVLDAAEQMGERYLADAEMRASIPHRSGEDGLPAMLQEHKDRLLDDWLYDGVVPAGDKKLHDVAEMLLGDRDDDDGFEEDSDGREVPVLPSMGATRAPLFPGTSPYALERNAHAERYGLEAWEKEFGEGALEGRKRRVYDALAEDGSQEEEEAAEAAGRSGGRLGESFREHKMRLVAASGVSGGMLVGGGGGRPKAKDGRAGMDVAAWQPPIDSRESDLVMVWKHHRLESRSGANFSYDARLPMVVPRSQLEAVGGAAYEGVLAPQTATPKQMMRQKDAAGNSIRALMLSPATHVKTLAVAKPGGKASVAPPMTKDEKALARLEKEIAADRLLTPLQQVEKYRPKIEERGSMMLTGAAKQTALIARAARLSRGKRARVDANSPAGRRLLEKGLAVPKNSYVPARQYRDMSQRLKKEYVEAKAEAREQGDEVTPRLVQAREALRYMGGTRNDVIATGARFGKRAEHMEIRKREDRSRGRRRGPYGLMHRSQGGTH